MGAALSCGRRHIRCLQHSVSATAGSLCSPLCPCPAVDIALRHEQVAVEVDGSSHFSHNEPHVPLGRTLWRWSLLQSRGWRVRGGGGCVRCACLAFTPHVGWPNNWPLSSVLCFNRLTHSHLF